MKQLNLHPLKWGLIFTAFGVIVSCSKNPTEPPSLFVSNNSIDMLTSGGETEISVTSNANWTLEGLPDWVSASTTTGIGSSKLKLTIDTNAAQLTRTASLILKVTGIEDVAVSIKQKGLVEWTKEISGFNGKRFLETSDGYIIAGTSDTKVSFLKLSKDGKEILKQVTLEPATGVTATYLECLDAVPGGGYVFAASISKPAYTDYNNWSLYIAKLSPDFTVIKERIIDYGIYNTESPTALCSKADGFVLAFSSYTNSSYSANIVNLDLNLADAPGSNGTINDIEDMKIAPDGSVLLAGYYSGKVMVAKYDKDLQFVDSYGDFAGSAKAIKVVSNGYLIAGAAAGSGGNADLFCMLLGNDMKPVNGKKIIIDRSKSDFATSIIALSDGGFAVSGRILVNESQSGYTVRLTKDLTMVSKKEVKFDENSLSQILAGAATNDGGYVVEGWGDGKATFAKINP